MGRRLGDAADPLLVSVRSGAKFSMPGMMDTVLNIGLSDDSVDGLAKQSGNERFAWDAYRRLIQMFGKTVLDIDGDHFEHAIEAAKQAKGAASDTQLDAEDLKALTATFKELVVDARRAGSSRRTRASRWTSRCSRCFDSWNSDRAVLYRRQERIPADLGTAVSVVAMVFGNLGDDSGTGVAFTRDPGTGAQGVYGDYLQNAQGEDVVAGHPQHGAAAGPRADRQGVLRPAAGHHADAGEPLPRPVRHRVHHRARQALDAADPGRQADRRRRPSASPSSW